MSALLNTPQGQAALSPLRARLWQAMQRHQCGELDMAIAGYREVLAADPHQFDGLRLLGAALVASGNAASALETLDRAVEVRADFAEVWVFRGDALAQMGRHAEAAESFERATRLQAGDAAVWTALGAQCQASKQPERAFAAFEQALAIDAKSHAAWSGRGLALDMLERPAEALDSYDRAIEIDGRDPATWCNRGKALNDLRRWDEALQSLDRSHALAGNMAHAWACRSTVLRSLGQIAAALAAAERACELEPRLASAWAARGTLLCDLGRHEEAGPQLDRAIELDPDGWAPRFNRAMLRLAQGDFKRGWDEYELRPGLRTITEYIPAPIWDGVANLEGKAIALQCEQGLGDTLQFARYARELVAQGAQVALAVPTQLHRLLASLGPGVRVLTEGDPMPPVDFKCPLLSLPARLRATVESIPSAVPYLRPPESRVLEWRRRLAATPAMPRRRLGLVFSGNAAHGNDRFRSIALETLAPTIAEAAAAGIEWHLLQPEVRAYDEPWLVRLGIVDHRSELTDFCETAALMLCVDAVVSVDTSVAHLAGALGVPLHLLVAVNPDWRWMLERGDSPWYPSARIYRQKTLGAWQAPLADLAKALVDGTSPPALAAPASAAASFESDGGAGTDWRDDAQLAQLQASARAAPSDASARFALALRYLALGAMDPGWDYYEWRCVIPAFATAMPAGGAFWDGSEPLEGKTILLCSEQGLGDVVQFCRYAPAVAAQGARVLLGVPPALARLARTLPGVAQVIAGDELVPRFDLKCLLLSLPQRFGTTLETIPAQVPYLAPTSDDVDAWRVRLGAAENTGSRAFRVGIACAGSASLATDAHRTIALERFAALRDTLAGAGQASSTRVELHLLQTELRESDRDALRELGAVDHRGELRDMADTAALIANLDAVVSVDTAVAHLAGALGAPLYLLLPETPDWRWMIGRQDSPWYPSARLFRQTRADDWDAPIARLSEALCAQLQAGVLVEEPCAARAARLPAHVKARLRRSAIAQVDIAGLIEAAARRHRGGEIGAAIEGYRAIIALDPTQFDAHRLLAAALLQAGRPGEAIGPAERALALRSDGEEPWLIHAQAHIELGSYERAVDSSERAVALGPDRADAWSAHGLALQGAGQVDEALDAFERAAKLAPADPQLRCNLGMARLLHGDFARGWKDFEARIQVPSMGMQTIAPCRPWDGREPLRGKTVLVACEQGLGDTIQFCRYAPLLAQRGARVILGVQPLLRDLLRPLGCGVEVVTVGDALPALDLHCWLLSLPQRLGTELASIPNSVPYLRASEVKRQAWRERLLAISLDRPGDTRARAVCRVGLAFSGAAVHANDSRRSIGLHAVEPLVAKAAASGIEWHLVQTEIARDDGALLARLGIHDHRSRLRDFSDTAALMANLDAVVSVDTAAAHLAGALGRPTFILLPVVPEWRWMLERIDSPWYPTARLLRQDGPDDWAGPLARLEAELLTLAPSRASGSGEALP